MNTIDSFQQTNINEVQAKNSNNSDKKICLNQKINVKSIPKNQLIFNTLNHGIH